MADYNRSWWDEIRDKGAEVLAAAKQYAEGKASEALSNAKSYTRTFANNGDTETLETAKSHADSGDTQALASAKSYADSKDAETLSSAKSYTRTFANNGDAETLQTAKNHADNGDAQTLSTAKSYANSQSDQARHSAIQWVVEQGLGGESVSVPNNDLNDAKNGQTRFYQVSGTETKNLPINESGVVLHIARGARPIQVYWSYLSRESYYRSYEPSGWSGWERYWNSGNLSPVTTNTDQTINGVKRFNNAILNDAFVKSASLASCMVEKYLYLYDYDDGIEQTALRCYVRDNIWQIRALNGGHAQISLDGDTVLHRGNFTLPEDKGAGAVGSYVFASAIGAQNFGALIAGRDLLPTSAGFFPFGSALSGTWRCMGEVDPNTSADNTTVTLFLRIA